MKVYLNPNQFAANINKVNYHHKEKAKNKNLKIMNKLTKLFMQTGDYLNIHLRNQYFYLIK